MAQWPDIDVDKSIRGLIGVAVLLHVYLWHSGRTERRRHVYTWPDWRCFTVPRVLMAQWPDRMIDTSIRGLIGLYIIFHLWLMTGYIQETSRRVMWPDWSAYSTSGLLLDLVYDWIWFMTGSIDKRHQDVLCDLTGVHIPQLVYDWIDRAARRVM